jgi:2-polyprenyl-3-methyl-5-hydroxy-6-metoxy-1,4-benzoquinol methylase
VTDLDEIYSAEWVAKDFTPELAAEFDVVAKALVRQFGIRSGFDVGCGPGFLLRSLLNLGMVVRGLEGSQACIDAAPSQVRSLIEKTDLRGPVNLDGAHIVICTEVAEHLDPEHAPHLVELLSSAMCPIVFTAAPPGQDGHHHVNCQTKQYWLDLFQAHGVIEDIQATFELKRRWSGLHRLSHMERNVMVFK